MSGQVGTTSEIKESSAATQDGASEATSSEAASNKAHVERAAFDLDPGLKRMSLGGVVRNFFGLTFGFVTPFIVFSISVFPVAIALLPFGATARYCEHMISYWILALRNIYGIELDVHGLNNIKADTPYVVVANHRSWLDALVIITALNRELPIGIVIKKSLSYIPLVGWYMQLTGYVAVERGGSSKGKLGKAAQRVRNGRSVLVFPEGSRAPTHRFLTCRKGAPILARDAEVQMLPIIVSGATYLWPKHTPFVRPGRIRLEVLEPITLNEDDDIRTTTSRIENVLIENYRLTPDSPKAKEVEGLVEALRPQGSGKA